MARRPPSASPRRSSRWRSSSSPRWWANGSRSSTRTISPSACPRGRRSPRSMMTFYRHFSEAASEVTVMPDKKTIERARRDKREGKSASTQAGEFVREEMHHIREGKHGARSAKQAIAIGLSEARQAGVDLPPPGPGQASEKTRKSAARAYARGHGAPARRKPSAKRSRAVESALKRDGQ